MAYGCRHSDSFTVQTLDAQGVMNVAARRSDEATDDYSRGYWDGVYAAFNMCVSHEWRDQADFYALLDLQRMVGNGDD